MTKSEVLADIRAKGIENSYRGHPTWDEAFKLYNEAHPNARKRMSCGSCFKDVLNWLKS